MPLFRSSRVLLLLVGLALLFGVATPAIQTACAMMTEHTQQTSMPCHGNETDDVVQEVVQDALTDRVDGPCCAEEPVSYHLCCLTDKAIPAAATPLSSTSSRALDLALAAVLSDENPPRSIQHIGGSTPRAPGASITAIPSRQALLATFLI